MRLVARQAVAATSPEWRQEASWRLCEILGAWLAGHPAGRRVATFAALPDEPDLRVLHEAHPAIAWHYPLVHPDDRLTFHRVRHPDNLREGRFGIREPVPEGHDGIAVADLDVILCPGLAFSRTGVRLGRGKGHYDRVLARARPVAPRVGVGFFAGGYDELPAEAHDVGMTHLAMPEGVVEV